MYVNIHTITVTTPTTLKSPFFNIAYKSLHFGKEIEMDRKRSVAWNLNQKVHHPSSWALFGVLTLKQHVGSKFGKFCNSFECFYKKIRSTHFVAKGNSFVISRDRSFPVQTIFVCDVKKMDSIGAGRLRAIGAGRLRVKCETSVSMVQLKSQFSSSPCALNRWN